MNFPLLAIILPLLCAVWQSLAGSPRFGALSNAVLSAVGLLLTLMVCWSGQIGGLEALFGALSGFVGLTTSLANIGFVEAERERLSARRWRAYHALFQLMLSLSLLGLYTDNTGLLWLALAGETLALALAVSLYGTPAALKAAWSYLLLGGVGVGLALFGTLMIYLAAQSTLGAGMASMSFSALSAHATHLEPRLLCLGFILIVFGYGIEIILLPLPGWSAAMCAAIPTPLSNVLRGLFANVALLAVLRFSHLVRACAGAALPASLLLSLSLIVLIFTAFMLVRGRTIHHFLKSVASQQVAISLFAFGIGGTLAIFGGILQMLLRTLLISGAFVAFAALTRGHGGADISFARLRGGVRDHKYAAWVLAITVFALSGLPPAAVFASAFMIIRQTVLNYPFLCLPFSIGIGLCAVLILRRVGGLLSVLVSVPATKPQKPDGYVGLAALHLVLALILAFVMPAPLMHLLMQAAGAMR